MKRLSLVVLAVASTAMAAGTAAAQAGGIERSDTRGPVVGINLNGSTLGAERATFRDARGAGLGLSLGYGVSDALSFFVRGNLAYRSGHFDLGARYTFGGADAALRPYVEAAATRAGTLQDDFRSDGTGATVGAGVEYFATRHVALDVGVAHSRGRFTNGFLDGDDFASTRLNVGIKWHP